MTGLSGERLLCKNRSLPFQQTVNVLHTEEGLRLALLYKRIHTNKKVFSILLAQCLPCIGCVMFISVRRLESQRSGSCSISVINNSTSKESKVDCFYIFRSPNKMTQYGNFPLRAACDTATR